MAAGELQGRVNRPYTRVSQVSMQHAIQRRPAARETLAAIGLALSAMFPAAALLAQGAVGSTVVEGALPAREPLERHPGIATRYASVTTATGYRVRWLRGVIGGLTRPAAPTRPGRDTSSRGA